MAIIKLWIVFPNLTLQANKHLINTLINGVMGLIWLLSKLENGKIFDIYLMNINMHILNSYYIISYILVYMN